MAGTPFTYHVEETPRPVADRPRAFLRAFAGVLAHSNYRAALGLFSNLGSRCGRCTVRCQLWLDTRAPRDMPCHRSQLLLRIFRYYFTPAGRLKRLLTGFRLTDAHLEEMGEEYYRCTACRRCRTACPAGIDHGLITHLARWLLAEVDIVPKALLTAVRQQLEGVGNTSGIPEPALRDTCGFLEEELEDLYGAGDVRFPIDAADPEYIFFPAVSDYLMEPDTLMGNAAVMHFTGAPWTIGSANFDAINYGLFFSDRVLEQVVANMVAESRRVGARKILVGECGHATRAAWYVPAFGGDDPPEVISFLEYTHQAIEEGKIPLRGKVVAERVTYHDPCNITREGRLTEEPRAILRSICQDFVEMTPNRTENFCCGGGGGTVSIDEIRSFRTGPMGRIKAEQIRATGAQIVVAPCANCKKQLREVCEDNGMPEVQVVGIHDLVLKAIDFGNGAND